MSTPHSAETATSSSISAREDAATFPPGGLRTILHSEVWDGPGFSILGERYRFLAQTHFALEIEIEGSGGGEPARGVDQSLFGWSFWSGCRPHEYAVVYGLLKNPRDTAWAQVAGGLRQLRPVLIPWSLHAGGVLVYGVLPRLPSELLVRAPGGGAVLGESLGSLPRENTETCEAQSS
jgi:hypothetical protein